MKRLCKNLYSFFILIIVIIIYLVIPQRVYADTTPYRSAGWVGTDPESTGRGYVDVMGCQESNDDLYCLRPSSLGGGSSSLFLSVFGRLEDFNIPLNSVINRVLIRVKGRSSTSLAIGVIDKYKHNSNSDLCIMKKPNDWIFMLNANTDSVVEYNTSIIEQELDNCINPKNIDFHNLTFRIRGLSTTNWFADIDNFEIAFDYTPPTVTPTPSMPIDILNGEVLEIGAEREIIGKKIGLADIVSVSNGAYHSLALDKNGSVWAWGNNEYGQLGDGTITNSETPVRVKGPNSVGFLKNVKMIASGGQFSMGLKNDGTVWVWGRDANGGRGVGSDPNNSHVKLTTPMQVRGESGSQLLSGIINISAGSHHSLGIKSNKKVVGWGLNTHRQVGGNCGTNQQCSTIERPKVIENIENVSSIAAGDIHSIAVDEDGSVWGWGSTGAGQLGREAAFTSTKSLPYKIVEISNIQKIASKGSVNVALSKQGTVLTWGAGDPFSYNGIPYVQPFLTGVKDISAGVYFSHGVIGHAIKEDGSLWELYINQIDAKEVSFGKKVSSVASGNGTPTLAVINDPGDVLGESDVAPFLRLPWDYEGKGLSFDDASLAINSFFDHQYPFLSIRHNFPEPPEYSSNTIGFDFFDKLEGYSSHDGYDWGKRANAYFEQPQLAAASGLAQFVGSCGACGNAVHINHGNGFQTRYYHLDEVASKIMNASESIQVEQGEQIGTIGFTGRVIPDNKDGAHIHFMVIQDKNGDGNFEDNIPDGLIDPFGWQSDEDDPWEKYEFNYNGVERAGSKSRYLWQDKISKITHFVDVDTGKDIIFEDYRLKYPAGAAAMDFTFTAKSSPHVSENIDGSDLRSVCTPIDIQTKDSIGNKITDFLIPFSLEIDFSDCNTFNIDFDSLEIFARPDDGVWRRENTAIDIENKKASAIINHNTVFALMGSREDTSSPVTSLSFIGESGVDNNFRSEVEIRLKADDGDKGVGVEYTAYAADEEDWNSYTLPFTIENEGVHKINYYSEDIDGNVEDVKTQEFVIDKTAPVSTISAEGQEGENGWYIRNPRVTISSEDSLSGVERIEYSTDGGENYQSYNNPFEIEDEGTTEILYRALDKAGNLEKAKRAEIMLDKTAPFSKIYISGLAGSEGWYRSNVSFELSGRDTVSGYAGSYYSTDGGESFSEYADTLLFNDEGEHEVVYYSVDIAGNLEDEKVIVFNIDKTAPVISISATPSELWPTNGKLVTVKVEGSVEEENLLRTQLAVEDEYGIIEPVINEFGKSIKLEARRDGNDRDGRIYTIGAISEDLAGNMADSEANVVVPHDRRN